MHIFFFFFSGILRRAKQKSPITENDYVNPPKYEILQWIVFWINSIQQRYTGSTWNIWGAVWTGSVILVSHLSLLLTKNSYKMFFMTQACCLGLFTFTETKLTAWNVKDNWKFTVLSLQSQFGVVISSTTNNSRALPKALWVTTLRDQNRIRMCI